MNNKLEVIGIDHGWSMMKTISQVFVTGVKEITTTPALFGDVLEYEGKFYKVGTVRQEVKDTKVEDDSFYLLTLAAVAKELKRRGLAEAKVFLAVGLPLTRFGAEKNDFIKYLTKNKRVSFKYENEPYYIEMDDVAVFPQCYAAVVDKIPTMAKKTLIVDIGSWTIDIMPVINKSPDESKCVTIPKGLITCMRSINEQCVRQLNSITISSTSVNTTATTGTFTSNAGKVETTSSCVFWLTGKSGYQEFISERPTADPIKAYIKVKTENIGYGELTKTDESSGVKLSGAVYGIYSDSGCTNRIQTMTTDGNGYAKSAALVAGTYYVKEITAPKGYVLSGKVHTLTVKAGQTTGISATDKEQLGAITIYKEGEVLSSWNGSNFTYEKKKLSGATFKVTAGADIYKADGTKVYSAGDVVAESLTTGTDGQVVLSDLHLGTYVVTEIKSIDGYTINTTPQTVAVEYKDQTVTVQYESTTIENTRQKADVSVVKKDSDTENPLDGGKYTLYAGNDIKNYAGQVIVTKGTALETVTTGEDGKASYSVDLPISNGYYVSETQAPYAYIRNSKDVYSFNFNVLPETQAKASFSHTFVNDRTTAKIHIYKVDKESGKAVAQGDASLEGAVYGLYARNDIVHPDGATGVVFKAGDLVATLTTDKNGEAEVNNLYLGNYYVKEITPSEGYLLDEEEHDVVCDYEGDLVAEVSRSTTSAEQVIKQPFQLIKVSDNGDDTEAGLLAGAEFTAYLKSSLPVKTDGSYDFDKATPVVIGENGATTITSDYKGHAVSIAIPYGTYVVVESKTPHNMKTIKPFEVKISENHPDKPQTWRVFLDREFTAKLRVIKKDSDTKQTVLVPNAEFKIFNIDKNEYVKQYTTYPSKVEHTSFFTDDDGDLILPEALKIGNYRIEEVSAPYGYVVNDKYVSISVDTDTAFETDGDTNDAIITVEYSDAPAVGELTVEKKGEVLDVFKGGLLASSCRDER